MKKTSLSILIGSVIVLLALVIRFTFPSSESFPLVVVVVEQGMSSARVAEVLKEHGVIRSSIIFRAILRIAKQDNSLMPGEYLFEKPQTVFAVAWRVASGDFDMEQKKAVIPEGSTNVQTAEAIKTSYPDFDDSDFLIKVYNKQGYLFPDTYFFLGTSSDEIIQILENHFDDKTVKLKQDAAAAGKDWNEVVTMASILEEEADTPEDFALVSGILWKRLEIGMALQVDAAPVTYKEPGLPAAPISNPGLATLEAAIHPTKSTYLYYLTGKDGIMHYAEDFEGHRKNVEKYLNETNRL